MKRENPWLNIGINILIPILILSKGSEWLSFLSPSGVLIVALAFPLAYFVVDLIRRRKFNGFSLLGFVSVLLTGGIGLLQLSPMVFAIKEAAIPLIFGVAILVSLKTKKPLIRLFLFNPSVMNVEKVDEALNTDEKQSAFKQLMARCTWILASSFLISAVLNFIISRWIVRTSPTVNAVAFNAEIGKQTGITWIVITVCTLPLMIFAMWQLFNGIKKLTGFGFEELLVDQKKSSQVSE